MMLVIDANCFFAAFLGNSASRKILLSENATLYSPDWLISEFERNERELLEKFPSSESFSGTKKILLEFVKIVSKPQYSGFFEMASKLVKHTKDEQYFALALHSCS